MKWVIFQFFVQTTIDKSVFHTALTERPIYHLDIRGEKNPSYRSILTGQNCNPFTFSFPVDTQCSCYLKNKQATCY